MIDFELDDLGKQRNFWIVVIGFLFAAGLLDLFFGEYLLGVTSLGSAAVFTLVAHEKLKEEA